jgi:hypothetical protein
MAMNVGKEIAALKRMTVTELRAKHVEAFGERTRSGHKDYLVKRIAWRLQAQAEGDLSERARRPGKSTVGVAPAVCIGNWVKLLSFDGDQ